VAAGGATGTPLVVGYHFLRLYVGTMLLLLLFLVFQRDRSHCRYRDTTVTTQCRQRDVAIAAAEAVVVVVAVVVVHYFHSLAAANSNHFTLPLFRRLRECDFDTDGGSRLAQRHQEWLELYKTPKTESKRMISCFHHHIAEMPLLRLYIPQIIIYATV
jgi:hypothetical protein